MISPTLQTTWIFSYDVIAFEITWTYMKKKYAGKQIISNYDSGNYRIL